MERKLGSIILHVSNVLQTAEWYERVFGLTRQYVTPDGSFAELRTHTALVLGLVSHELGQRLFPRIRKNTFFEDPSGVHLSFLTDQVQALYELALQNGAVSAHPPTLQPWGREEACVRDPNGILITLVASEGVGDLAI